MEKGVGVRFGGVTPQHPTPPPPTSISITRGTSFSSISRSYLLVSQRLGFTGKLRLNALT